MDENRQFLTSSALKVDRGAGDWLWLGRQPSYRPAALCEGSQEAVLRRSGGVLVVDCPSFVLESSKVRGTCRRKSAKIRTSEVVFSVVFSRFYQSFRFRNCPSELDSVFSVVSS